MLCPHCGTILRDGTKFCTECGAALQASPAEAPEPVSFTVPGVPPVIEPVAPFTGLDADPSEGSEAPASQPDDAASEDPFAAFNQAARSTGLIREAPPAYTAPAPAPAPRPSAPPTRESAPASVPAGGYSVPGEGYVLPDAPPPSAAAGGAPQKKRGWIAVLVLVLVLAAAIAAGAAAFAARRSPSGRPTQAVIVQPEGGSLGDKISDHLHSREP